MDAPTDIPNPALNTTLLNYILRNLDAEELHYDSLNPNTQSYFRHTTSTVVYMSICLSCTIWQVLTAAELAWKVRKWLHFAVLFETVLSLITILCSVLNPVTPLSCEFRFWVSILCVNLGGCCIQTILLYKAYICYDRSKWLLVLGSFINLGYIALTFVYATLGKVPTYKDILGNCVMKNLEWPALAKLGLDISSNVFLSIAFLMVIYRHYRIFGNSLHKTLLSGGIIFSVGVIASNICTAILISSRVMGGLSADLYSFDWVITSYLLIKQFKNNRPSQQSRQGEEDDEEAYDDSASKTMQTIMTSTFDMLPTTAQGPSAVGPTKFASEQHIIQPISSATMIDFSHRKGSLVSTVDHRTSTGVMSNTTTVHTGFDRNNNSTMAVCENCLAHLPSLSIKSPTTATATTMKYNQDEQEEEQDDIEKFHFKQ